MDNGTENLFDNTECWCPDCNWIGVGSECIADIDHDGNWGCPECNAVVAILC